MSRYKDAIDPRSAHEILLERSAQRQQDEQDTDLASKDTKKSAHKRTSSTRSREGAGEAFLKSLARAAGSQLGRKLFRGVLGSLLK